jgi:arylsulfatase A-like enzyme
MQYLSDSGLANYTMLWYTSDHGEMFGSQGRRCKKYVLRRSLTNPLADAMAGTHIPAAKSQTLYFLVDFYADII